MNPKDKGPSKDLAEAGLEPNAVEAQLACHRVRLAGGSASIEVDCSVKAQVPARIDVFDIAGRRCVTHEWQPGTAGRQVLSPGMASPIRAGLYFVRLTQGARQVSSKALLTR